MVTAGLYRVDEPGEGRTAVPAGIFSRTSSPSSAFMSYKCRKPANLRPLIALSSALGGPSFGHLRKLRGTLVTPSHSFETLLFLNRSQPDDGK
jgi:hypothetical protein